MNQFQFVLPSGQVVRFIEITAGVYKQQIQTSASDTTIEKEIIFAPGQILFNPALRLES